METKILRFCGVIAIILGITTSSDAVQSNTPFSQHGVIQNVQNYSSNPFWNPNAPYNQRMPTPVYAKGTDVKTSECQGLLAVIIAQQCNIRNNCANTRLSDIRPAIVVQLSQLPGGSYSTACAGFIDSAFNEYVTSHQAVALPTMPTAFPEPTVVNPGVTNNTISTPQIPDWAQQNMARQAELQALQQQTGSAYIPPIKPTEFPTTYADLSFSERLENEKAGYEPYKDKSAYVQIEIESQEAYLERQAERQRLLQEIQETRDYMNLDLKDYCKKYPEKDRCKQFAQEQQKEKADRDKIIKKIAEALQAAKK